MNGPPPGAADAPLVALVRGIEGVAVAFARDGQDTRDHLAADSVEVRWWPMAVVREQFSEHSRQSAPRWVVWSSRRDLSPLVASSVPVARSWDIAEVHRLIGGAWRADPAAAWALVQGLDPATAPVTHERRAGYGGDLFDAAAPVDIMVRPDGHLEPLWFEQSGPDRARQLAVAALQVAHGQRELVAQIDPSGRMLSAAWSESAAAVLCLELERDGLPIDRTQATELIAVHAGPRPRDAADAKRIRASRDQQVLAHVPGRDNADLRNPAQVKTLLSAVGLDLPTTRKWSLEPYRSSYPLVDALLRWRADERIATTYGYRWLDEHVGPDDRLRGTWSACDGAAGRMTAGNGLHNLPVPLRRAVAAVDGHVFVRADLGQIEPRVLAVVSGDPAFAAATRADDLYLPVAEKLGVDRAVAKVAVLAAMYGQRSGAAGEAWADLERVYPVAMGLLEQAARDGAARKPLRTWGGRLITFGDATVLGEGGADEPPGEGAPWSAAARGRYARNAIIQGSAAELFKAWAVTVREATRPHGGQIVLCLHDELLVHCPTDAAEIVEQLVHLSLTEAAQRWARSNAVRFVADVSIVQRWSEAKA